MRAFAKGSTSGPSFILPPHPHTMPITPVGATLPSHTTLPIYILYAHGRVNHQKIYIGHIRARFTLRLKGMIAPSRGVIIPEAQVLPRTYVTDPTFSLQNPAPDRGPVAHSGAHRGPLPTTWSQSHERPSEVTSTICPWKMGKRSAHQE